MTQYTEISAFDLMDFTHNKPFNILNSICVLNDSLKSVDNAEKRSHIGKFEFVDEHRSPFILMLESNKPASWTSRLFHLHQSVYIVRTTSDSTVDHERGKEKKLG
uniref:Uncharacterized protein n=1 Tax=Leersia perrieri TaxID=77586 RepID=A0A0D9UWU9_9ORYZ